ncbi:MAG TPA: hypothetical protein VFF27_00695 [Bacteroidia bacterium]|jgi:hypothetical protein|nr:hypothetical protein [Bacteroidia bacterium]
MINTPVILTSDYSLLAGNVYHAESFIYALNFNNLSCFEKLTLNSLHSYKVDVRDVYFAIYFNFSENDPVFFESLSNWKELILHYFFHPNYKIVQNKPMVFLNTNDSVRVKEQLLKLEDYIISQGYDGWELINMSSELNTKNSSYFHANDDLNMLSRNYHQLLEKNYCADFIILNDSIALSGINTLSEVENTFRKDLPDHYYQLNEYKQLIEEVKQLRGRMLLMEKDLRNQKQYLEIYKSLDESTKIIEFYRNEYEILPSWYKKLGHILKVLTGKRSFRSLFDNNVKKYKN